MNKDQMAHELLVSTLKSGAHLGFDHAETAQYFFDLADAMQKEWEKRCTSPLPESFFDLTKDENGKCLHFHHEFGHQKCMDCGSSLSHLNSEGLDIQGMLHSIDNYFDQAECSKTQRVANNLIAEIYEKLSAEVKQGFQAEGSENE